MTDWDIRLVELARLVSTWSKDPERKVGAVIADTSHRILGIGYNGLPRGVRDLPERLTEKDERLSMSVHAEANALLNTAADTRGAILYSTYAPCAPCAALIVQAGITRVVCPVAKQGSSWTESWKIARVLLDEAGVEVVARYV